MARVYKKVSYFLIFLIIFSVSSFGQTTTCIRVDSSDDDAEEFEDGEYLFRNSRDLELVYDDPYTGTGFRNNQLVGIRFNSVDVPQGATIINAYIQFTADPIVTTNEEPQGGNSVDPCNLTIFGEATGNANDFLNNGLISNRARTNANVTWSPPPWPNSAARTDDQKTVDISIIIQEIVNRCDYSINNSMAIIISGFGRRTAASWDGANNPGPDQNPENSPELCIEYDASSIGVCGPDYTYDNGWQGSIDPNGIATNLEDILIKSGNATITSNTTANTVVINPGATLSVDPNISLTANVITLESESDQYSSLDPADGTSIIIGTVNYNRFTNQIGSGSTGGNDLISAPLSGQNFGAFASANPNLASPITGVLDRRGFGPFSNDNGLYQIYLTTANLLTPLEAGKGYRAATDDGSPLKFKGTVNTGDVNTNISVGVGSKWNLVGNPYTSYLNSQAFLAANGGVLDPIYNSIYGYNDGTDGGSIWTIINSLQNPGKNIAPGQGFFVAAKDPGEVNVTFISGMRTITGTDDFIVGRNGQDSSVSHLRLTIDNSSTSYSTDFYFTDNCTLELDPGYDAGSFDARYSDLSIYSHLVSNNTGIDMAIQALSNSDMNDVVIPLGINAVQGLQIKVSISESDLPETTQVYLEDNVANTFTLLNTSDYIFTPLDDLNGVGRFFLHYSSTTLSLNDENLSGLQIFTSANPKLLHVNGKLIDSSILDLYDIQGRLVLNEILDQNSYSNEIDISTISNGIYVIKIKMGGILKTQKVIIR